MKTLIKDREKEEVSMNNECRNVIEMENNVEVITELKVTKITSDEIKRLINGEIKAFDHGCGITTYVDTCTHKDMPIDFPIQKLPVLAVKLPYDKDPYYVNCPCNTYEVEFMARVINEMFLSHVIERRWESMDFDDYWSLNPSSYYSF